MKLFIHRGRANGTSPGYRITMPDDGLRYLGIFRGDVLRATPQRRYCNGDIVAVRVGSRLYVRRAYNDGRYLLLEAENPGYLRLSIERDTPGIRLLGKITRALPATA